MPDFIAGSLSAATFCLGLATLNALTRLAGPPDLMEGGFVQYGAALLFAGLTGGAPSARAWRPFAARPASASAVSDPHPDVAVRNSSTSG